MRTHTKLHRSYRYHHREGYVPPDDVFLCNLGVILAPVYFSNCISFHIFQVANKSERNVADVVSSLDCKLVACSL